MRQRSGGFHSDTLEQYKELAEQGEGKMGLFYEDQNRGKDRRKRERRQKREQNKTVPCVYASFDHNPDIEEKQHFQELEKIIQKQGIIIRNYVIVCQSNQIVYRHLGQCTYDGNRSLDLIVRKRRGENKAEHIHKYWIMNEHLLRNHLSQSYLNRASKVFTLGVHVCSELRARYRMQDVQLHNFAYILEKQQHY